MAVIFTGDRRSEWGTWQGPAGGEGTRAFDDFSNPPPDARFDRSIRMRRFQGDYSQWIPSDQGSLSRAQLQGPTTRAGVALLPIGGRRWVEWWVKFNSVAPRASDDFHMYVESHTPSANPGGVWTGNLSEIPTVHKFRNWRGPGAFTHSWDAETPVVIGEWHHHLVEVVTSTGSGGYLEYRYDGEAMFSRSGANTTQSGNHYPEIGFYTYWSVTGTDDMNIVLVVHDTDPGYPGSGGGGGGGGGTNPDPPELTINKPLQGGVFVGELPFDVSVANAPEGYALYVGLGEYGGVSQQRDGGDEPHAGALDLSPLPGQDTATFYAALHASPGGTMLDSDLRTVTVSPEVVGQPGQSLSGNVQGNGTLSGNVQFAEVVEVTNVANIGQEVVSYRRPLLVEILPDGSHGARVVWNSSNGRFEYLDQQS